MSASPATPEINLVAGDELSGRPGGRFVSWALSYGKAVIVITELIVVLVFISRFAIDSQIADLNEQMGKKKDIIVGSKDFEDTFRSFSLRVGAVSELTTPLSIDKILTETKNLIPQGISVNDLGIKDKDVSLNGSAKNESDLAVLSGAFKNSSNFSQVTLTKVSRDTTDQGGSSEIDFSLTAKYQQIAK